MFRSICVFASLAFVGLAKGDSILDDFSVPQAPVATEEDFFFVEGITDPVPRTTGTVVTIDGTTALFSDFGSAFIQYDFAATTSGDVFDPGENFMVFRNVTTSAAGTIRVDFRNNAPYNQPPPMGSDISFVSRDLGVISNEDIVLNITGISNITETDSITVTWDDPIGFGTFATSQIDFTSVPEPSSLALACAGLAGLAIERRRRAKNAASAA